MKNIKYLLVLFILSLLFVSCEKQPQKEWTKLYGYTTEEIAGTYAFSNISDAFESLTENAYCHVCEDAKSRPRATDDDYLINLTYPAISSHPTYELTAYVYKNNQGDIRIHGFARHVIYETVYNPSTEQNDYVPKSRINYYFDVIKN